jgi:integrase
MRFEQFPFGLIRIDGLTYEHDVVIDRGEVRKRKKNQRRHDPGQDGAMLGLLLGCGLRRSEVVGLDLDQLQNDRLGISVARDAA